MSTRKVLVTGGAGFIGSHLSEALIARGDEVFVLDDLSTGRMENLERLEGHPAFHFTLGTILDLPLLEKLIGQVDLVFHMAAVVGVHKIIQAPVETIEVNAFGGHNVLSLAARHRKLCLVASTSEVYGKSTKHPFSEEDDVIYGPTTKSRWSYACSKAIDEFLALAYHSAQGSPMIVVRLFNTTGPRQTGQYGMVLPRFVEQALRRETITVFGTGRQSRCFADVGDVVRALLMLMESPSAIGQVFNIGNPEEISIGQLAKLVKQMTGSNSAIEFVPYDEAYQPGFEDMHRRVPSIAKISQLVGFEPQIKLQQIVQRVIDHKRQALQESVAVPISADLRPRALRVGAGD